MEASPLHRQSEWRRSHHERSSGASARLGHRLTVRPIQRACGLLFGIGTHVLFAHTVYRLFLFLQGPAPNLVATAPALSLAGGGIDLLLAAQFGLLHSWLLSPPTRTRLERFIPGPLYGCFFCVMTCLCLLGTMAAWRTSSSVVWLLHGGWRTAVTAGFILSWVALAYSLHLTGLGYQTGWTPWWAWLRDRPPAPRRFRPRGAYRILRHPVYLSFLGLIWLTPSMTLDRALLTAVWTVYIFAGSYRKDQRLTYYLGDVYRRYQARVPGYPFFFGFLGRVHMPISPRKLTSANSSAIRIISSPKKRHNRLPGGRLGT